MNLVFAARSVAAPVLLALLTQNLTASTASDGGEFVNLEKLSDRVVLAYWSGTDRRCNLTAIRTEKGLVMIDTEMSPRLMKPVKLKLEQYFGRNDWVCVINTHAHDNHCGGNGLFPPALIVGHENLAEDMQWMVRRQTDVESKARELGAAAKLIGNLKAALPGVSARSAREARLVRGEIKFWELHSQDLREGYDLVKPARTFSETDTLDFGDARLELVFFGKGHSNSDTLIYVPKEKLLVTGAIVYQRGQFPEIGESSTLADVRRFLAVLDRFLSPQAGIDHVVASHSPPLTKRDLAPVRDYYQRMLAGVRAAQQRRLTLEQAQAGLDEKMFPAFHEKPPGTWSHGMHQRNLRNLWKIVELADASAPGSAARATAPAVENLHLGQKPK